jgi:hypothetical protein
MWLSKISSFLRLSSAYRQEETVTDTTKFRSLDSRKEKENWHSTVSKTQLARWTTWLLRWLSYRLASGCYPCAGDFIEEHFFEQLSSVIEIENMFLNRVNDPHMVFLYSIHLLTRGTHNSCRAFVSRRTQLCTAIVNSFAKAVLIHLSFLEELISIRLHCTIDEQIGSQRQLSLHKIF